MKGQISTEVLLIIGVMLLLLAPLLLYAFGRINVSNEDISVQKAEFAAHRLITAADAVGYLGGSAGIVEEIEVPANVVEVKVSGSNDLVFVVDTSSGKRDIVKSSSFRLDSDNLGDMDRAGTYFVKITSIDGAAGTGSVRLEVQ